MDYTLYQGRGTDKITGALRPLAYLPNTSEWVPGIYCLEAEDSRYQADEVLGGVTGIDNAQAQALSNRTQFLRVNLARLANIVAAMQLAMGPMLRTIKTLKISHTEPTDTDYSAWMDLERNGASDSLFAQMASDAVFDLRLEYQNGTYSKSPVLELTESTGAIWYIRTDGTTVLIDAVEDQLDADAISSDSQS